jgi:hypothetical protein
VQLSKNPLVLNKQYVEMSPLMKLFSDALAPVNYNILVDLALFTVTSPQISLAAMVSVHKGNFQQ